MNKRRALYWVIKCPQNHYWLEEGGVTPKQRDAEKFKTRKLAKAEIEKWCHPHEKAWVCRVVKRMRRVTCQACGGHGFHGEHRRFEQACNACGGSGELAQSPKV